MILSDYHMHSEFSSDSDTPMELMIEKSIQTGLKQICFTDHMDYDYPKINLDTSKDSNDVYLDFLFDPDAYIQKLRKLQALYRGKIDIRIGIELGLKNHIQDKVQHLMENHSFDFVIGSSHLLYNDDPYLTSFWDKLREHEGMHSSSSETDERIVKKAIRDYFEEILLNIDSFPWFQVYGHLDYIVRYAPGKDTYYHVDDYMDILEAILKKLIETNRGIELNTSGLKSGLQYANPHMKILKLYRSLGGEIITVGSDAHYPQYIGYEFMKANEFLKESGFRYYTTFQSQKAEFHPLS